MPRILTKWQRFETLSSDELYQLLRFRQGIFVVEQQSPYPDLDGLDQRAWHLLLLMEGELSGYLRVIPDPGPPPLVRIGRVAVSLGLRRRGLGHVLMNEAMRLQRRDYAGAAVVLDAQHHLERFYRGFGFAAVGEPYDEFGVRHVEMRLRPHP